jgi:small GTP-binding protein
MENKEQVEEENNNKEQAEIIEQEKGDNDKQEEEKENDITGKKDENNNKEEKEEVKTTTEKDDEVFLAPEDNNISKEKINYKNLLTHAPKTEIEILDNVVGDQYDINFKIIVIGNSGVGKSCITLKATQDIFKEDIASTIGFQFFSFHVKIDDKIFKLQIWDTCGQEIYRSLITNFYRSTALAIICYSVTDAKSFQEIDIWLKQLKMNADPDCKVFLIANKIDLPNRVISSEEGMKCKKEHGFECYMETSAKTGVNVKELFVNCALALYRDLPKYIKEKEMLETDLDLKKFNLNEDTKVGENECSC